MTVLSRLRRYGLALFFILVTLVPEFGGDILEGFGIHSRPRWAKVFDAAFWYQLLLRAGPHAPRSKHVDVVVMQERALPDGALSNPCNQRLLLARLLERLNAAGAGLIVLDRYFTSGGCPESDGANASLIAAVAGSRAPIVVGLHTVEREGGELVLPRHFELGPAPHVTSGLIRIGKDTRRIPLGWGVLEKSGSLLATMPTLAYVAASRSDPKLESVRRLQRLREANVHPYTGFIPPGEIRTFSILDLVCGAGAVGDWRSCAMPSPTIIASWNLSGRIVVVGDDAEKDRHSTVLGVIQGVALQANYIEALRDDAYLVPIPRGWNFSFNMVIAILVGGLFARASTKHRRGKTMLTPSKAAVLGLVLTLFAWLVAYLIAIQAGYYLAVWLPFVYALYIAGMLGHAGLHRASNHSLS
jgi:CHASE2 domain-containing sensor protein